jgi:hypothetical protein
MDRAAPDVVLHVLDRGGFGEESEPPPARRMAGMALVVPKKTRLTLTAMMPSQSSSVVSSMLVRMVIDVTR